MTPELSSESFCLDPDHQYPYYITAKRYSLEGVNETRTRTKNPLTLILLHSIGFPKEIWEPTLRDLFALFLENGLADAEAWSIECPNHGSSAILNDDALRRLPREVTDCEWELRSLPFFPDASIFSRLRKVCESCT